MLRRKGSPVRFITTTPARCCGARHEQRRLSRPLFCAPAAGNQHRPLPAQLRVIPRNCVNPPQVTQPTTGSCQLPTTGVVGSRLRPVPAASQRDIARLAAYADTVLDLARAQHGGGYFYQSLPLCVLDAVFSLGVRYQAVRNVVARHCADANVKQFRPYGSPFPPREDQESIGSSCNRLRGWGTPDLIAARLGSRQRTSTHPTSSMLGPSRWRGRSGGVSDLSEPAGRCGALRTSASTASKAAVACSSSMYPRSERRIDRVPSGHHRG